MTDMPQLVSVFNTVGGGAAALVALNDILTSAETPSMGAGTLMENRKRNVHLHVMVTPDELAAIHERMAEAGISNAGAYVRKMALNGYILHIDLTPVKELISLQRRCSNNLNQVAVHAHTYGVYPEEIDGLKRDYEKLWGEVSKVLRELSELVAK